MTENSIYQCRLSYSGLENHLENYQTLLMQNPINICLWLQEISNRIDFSRSIKQECVGNNCFLPTSVPRRRECKKFPDVYMQQDWLVGSGEDAVMRSILTESQRMRRENMSTETHNLIVEKMQIGGTSTRMLEATIFLLNFVLLLFFILAVSSDYFVSWIKT